MKTDVLEHRTPTAQGSATILIVEDDPGIAELESGRLEDSGYQVRLATSPVQAIEEVSRGGIDLILLDYRLPGDVNGLDLHARIRALGYDPPVILVTGFGNEATVIQALRAGVRDFVTKSLEYLDYLPEAVGRILRQVQTEQRLAESEARLASIIASAKDAIIVAEADRRISLFNAAAVDMFRCPAEEALGRRLTDFIPDEFAPSTPGEDPSLSVRLRQGTNGQRTNGEMFPLEASVSSGRVGNRKFVTVVVRDMTEKRELEARSLHAQRMETVGTLAGGVAHDFNNLLTVINGYTDMMLQEAAPDDPARTSLFEIRQAGERAAGLTRQLLTFSRKEVVSARVFDLNRLVAELGGMLRRLIGEHIELSIVPAKDLPRIRADPGQIEQIIMNLVVNARDAMVGGGRVQVETRNIEVLPEHARRKGLPSGPFVMLTVSDTGCGMSDTVRRKIFEPFFTTKEPGKGTGLGLATVHGIVQQSGGHIDVKSELGRGTSLEVYLPVAVNETNGAERGSAHRETRGTETILIAEDEDGVRKLASLSLQANGYTVLLAEDGEEAIRIAATHQGPLHLLLTDMVMPRMSGRDLAAQLMRDRPSLKALFLSGYTDAVNAPDGAMPPRTGFLHKPFTPILLAEKVRELLESVP